MISATPLTSSGQRRLRTDIQLLRAVAVGMVVLFHAQVPGLSGGFLGVDIFLVISGYLITGMIARGIKRGEFKLGTFFLDRAKRLLPAAYTVYSLTGLVALWVLTKAEMQRYLETLFGALTFSANILLWQGTNYFASEAKFNVLLHTWSLSLEEQFYFILPLSLLFIPRRFWLTTIAGAFAMSLLLCWIATPLSPVASFYLLPTRGWELLLGSLIALNEDRLGTGAREVSKRLSTVAMGVLVLVPIYMPGTQLGYPHPSLDAMLVTLATAIIIIGQPSWLNHTGKLTGLGYWIGGISYSLYLVHWPIFAFALNAYLGEAPPLAVRLGLIGLSVLLAAGLQRWVERPVHQMDLNGRRPQASLIAIGLTACLALGAFGTAQIRTSPRDYMAAAKANIGLDATCDYSNALLLYPSCQTGEELQTLVWGDSFAMHLVDTLSENMHPLVQATKSGCAPALGVAPIVPETWQDAGWATDCINFNNSVISYLKTHPEIKTVVISSPFDQILGKRETGLLLDSGNLRLTSLTVEKGSDHFLRTLETITTEGRKVLVVGPTPTIGIDMRACIERAEMGLITLGPYRNCVLYRDEAKAYRSAALALLERADRLPNVTVIDLIEVLCPREICNLYEGEALLFRDAGHLSNDASRLLGERDGLGIAEALAAESTLDEQFSH